MPHSPHHYHYHLSLIPWILGCMMHFKSYRSLVDNLRAKPILCVCACMWCICYCFRLFSRFQRTHMFSGPYVNVDICKPHFGTTDWVIKETNQTLQILQCNQTYQPLHVLSTDQSTTTHWDLGFTATMFFFYWSMINVIPSNETMHGSHMGPWPFPTPESSLGSRIHISSFFFFFFSSPEVLGYHVGRISY